MNKNNFLLIGIYSFFLVTSSENVVASVDASVVKLLDGRSAFCASSVDLSKPAYAPSGWRVESVDTQSLVFSIDLQSLTCAKRNGQFGWEPRSLWVPYALEDINGKQYLNRLEQLEFLLVDGNQQVLFATPVIDTSLQRLRIPFRWDHIFPRSRDTAIRSGEVVNVSFELFLRGVRLYSRNSRDFESLGQFAGGAYRITFSFEKQGEKVVLLGTRVN